MGEIKYRSVAGKKIASGNFIINGTSNNYGYLYSGETINLTALDFTPTKIFVWTDWRNSSGIATGKQGKASDGTRNQGRCFYSN